jgi:predicted transcriptional regulator
MEKIDKKTIKALATESRVNILRALAQRRKMPSELSKELGLAASTIIGHLGI